MRLHNVLTMMGSCSSPFIITMEVGAELGSTLKLSLCCTALPAAAMAASARGLAAVSCRLRLARTTEPPVEAALARASAAQHLSCPQAPAANATQLIGSGRGFCGSSKRLVRTADRHERHI